MDEGTSPREPTVVESSAEHPGSLTPAHLLAAMLTDKRFSDIQVNAGQAKQAFHLHRAVITHESTFFQAACKEGAFKEGVERNIALPDIEPPIFDVIVNWMYQLRFELPFTNRYEGSPEENALYKRKLDDQALLKIYEAVDYLGLGSLRKTMLSRLESLLYQEITAPKEDCTVELPFTLIQGICRRSSHSDWTELAEIMDNTVPIWTSNSIYHRLRRNEEGSVFMAGLMVQSLNRFVHSILCLDCMGVLMGQAPSICVNCKKKETSPPE